MRRMIMVSVVAAVLSAIAPGTRADVIGDYVVITGNDVPTNPVIDGLPGFSGYTLYVKAKQPGDTIMAIDVGWNMVDFPNASVVHNWGIFGPEHQHWFMSRTSTIPTPEPNDDELDSHFLFTYNAAVMAPRENNNTSPGGITSPLADDEFNDWGVGDTMRAIVGIANMHSDCVPFVYLVIPDGQTVQVSGQFVTHRDCYPSAFSPAADSGGGDYASELSFTVGAVPEPATLAMALPGLAVLLLRGRRRRPS